MINNNFHREILASVINTSKYNLDNNDVNNAHVCYQIYSMIEAWHSGITILKNAQGDRLKRITMENIGIFMNLLEKKEEIKIN